MDDGHKLLENAAAADSRKDLVAKIAGAGEGEPAERKPPAGCVERILNFKDRNYLVGAALAYCGREGHKTYKDQRKLEQLKKLVNFEATLDHTAEITDAIELEQLKWAAAKEKYKAWVAYREGLLDAVAVAKLKIQYPDMSLDQGPEKPPVRPPDLAADTRGPDSTFYLPSKLDAWVQVALAAMEWPANMAEYAVELCEKFGIKDE